jgi:hypothetical protein
VPNLKDVTTQSAKHTYCQHSCTKLHNIISQKQSYCYYVDNTSFDIVGAPRILKLVCHFYKRLRLDIFQGSVLKIEALSSSVNVNVIPILRSGTILSKKHNSITLSVYETTGK